MQSKGGARVGQSFRGRSRESSSQKGMGKEKKGETWMFPRRQMVVRGGQNEEELCGAMGEGKHVNKREKRDRGLNPPGQVEEKEKKKRG